MPRGVIDVGKLSKKQSEKHLGLQSKMP
jgi:hypothetical protein